MIDLDELIPYLRELGACQQGISSELLRLESGVRIDWHRCLSWLLEVSGSSFPDYTPFRESHGLAEAIAAEWYGLDLEEGDPID